ncbi:XrtA system polysaccharide chain length determinant [Plasticicumulans acidivorans]|uniref:Polysaccharide chain length determinant protein (PEP-CTERM system associated) n=1 Tax=Plasticicumulans acidivorans TaxID=886464 RepID=A0A317N0Q1_9GAMM|nr:XrtA system polysaccharide chain length determinant [Plasticicumulans acidivorans]PWV65730.1 polysaccharide chain length determinant protein (PEP-CTERM system associated) [Plasticicumulans acidivorans]
MHDIVELIFTYLRAIWRYRWYALIIAWTISLGGWFVVHRMPDQYVASARVYVDTQSILRPLLRGLAVDVNPDAQIQLMTRTLLSRPNLEKVARMTDLDLRARDNAQMDALLDRLAKKISLQTAGRENLYSIGFEDKDPTFAKKVVQSLLTIFVENALGESRQDSDSAQRFLDKQIAEYEARLSAAEERLKAFKRQNVGLMPSSAGDHFERMQQAATELSAAELELKQAENRRDVLKQQVDGEQATFGIGPKGTIANNVPSITEAAPVDGRIRAMEERLDQLLLQYTDKHPDVIAVRQTLDELRKQRAQELASINSAKSTTIEASGGDSGNLLYQQIMLALSNEEANVASLQVRVDTFKKRLAEMQGLVNSVPEVEAQFKALNRDYDVTRQNYDQLLSRRESARISQQAGQTSEDIRFKVIDPPRVPNEPSGPNRLALMSGVFVAAIGAGIVVAFLMSQLRPTFDNRRILADVTNFPVLGTVSVVISPAAIRHQRISLAGYVGSSTLLLLVYGALLIAQLTGHRLL